MGGRQTWRGRRRPQTLGLRPKEMIGHRRTQGATGDASSEEETAGRRTRCTAQRIGSSSEKTNGKTIGDRQMQRNRLDLESWSGKLSASSLVRGQACHQRVAYPYADATLFRIITYPSATMKKVQYKPLNMWISKKDTLTFWGVFGLRAAYLLIHISSDSYCTFLILAGG